VRTIYGEYLIELRNPWCNNNNWKGKWNLKSDLWTKEIKKELKIKPKKPKGRFFMPIAEFVKYFNKI
jgi:calpain-15